MSKMIISPRTIQLLKNFSTINQSLVVKPGGVLSTMSPGRTVLAYARIDEDFETTFGIYDLPKFLSVMSLFKEPSIIIHEGYMTIMEGSKKVNYTFADLSLLQNKEKLDPYEVDKKDLFPTVDVEFNLKEDDFADIKKAISILRLPEVAVIGDGSTIALEVLDSKNPSGDVYAIELGETEEKFNFIFREENIKINPGDYKVQIHWGVKKLSRFIGMDCEYFIAIEGTSTYEKGKNND